MEASKASLHGQILVWHQTMYPPAVAANAHQQYVSETIGVLLLMTPVLQPTVQIMQRRSMQLDSGRSHRRGDKRSVQTGQCDSKNNLRPCKSQHVQKLDMAACADDKAFSCLAPADLDATAVIIGRYFVSNVSVDAAACHQKCTPLCIQLRLTLIAASNFQHRIFLDWPRANIASLDTPSKNAPHNRACRANKFEDLNPRGEKSINIVPLLYLPDTLPLVFYFCLSKILTNISFPTN